MSSNSESFSILTIGDPKVGKTSLSLKFISNSTLEKYTPTIGIDYHYKDLQLIKYTLKITIWDTAGQEKFSVLNPNYLKKSNGVMFVFDLTDRKTFDKMDSIISGVKDIVTNTPFILVGNKSDLPNRQVTSEEGEKLANSNDMTYFECSIKDNSGVNESFFSLIRDILQVRGKGNVIKELNNYAKKNIKTQNENVKTKGVEGEVTKDYTAYTFKLKGNKDGNTQGNCTVQ